VSRCQKKSSSGLYGATEDIRGRHTDNPAGATPSGLISDPPPSSTTIFMPDALPAATLPIYPGLGQVPNMLACIPSSLVINSILLVCCSHKDSLQTQITHKSKQDKWHTVMKNESSS